jgi:hypothetical protein
MITSLIMCEIHGREDVEDHMSIELRLLSIAVSEPRGSRSVMKPFFTCTFAFMSICACTWTCHASGR